MGIECGHTAHDAREAGVVGLCGGCVRIEMAVVGHCICAVRDEIVETAQRGQHTSQRDPAAQGVADELLDVRFLHDGAMG